MRRLIVIGTTPNGDGVVLSDDKGAKFFVANDPRLAAVTHHDLSRQLEMALHTFSPREIQSRVRGGASAEVVAAETGWPLEKVLRYAEPLLAERAYIAGQAQGVEVRRSGGGATLLEAAAAALGAEPEAVVIAWDAWRREDGKWVVTATYSGHDGPHSAQWTYDHSGRNIHPLDDSARILMGARPAAPEPTGEDAITDALALIAERTPEPVDSPRRLKAVPDSPEPDDTEAVRDYTSQTVTISHPSGSEVSATEEPTPLPAKPAPRKAKPRKGRASVPSWDEILFGTGRPEE
jgi:hypothetical protein